MECDAPCMFGFGRPLNKIEPKVVEYSTESRSVLPRLLPEVDYDMKAAPRFYLGLCLDEKDFRFRYYSSFVYL